MANINKLIENADNAYYAAEYDKAIKLYQQVLDIDVDNKHVRQQLRKSEINRSSKDTNPSDLPVEALQCYKRSRSFIMAGDLTEAKRLLRRAIQSAEDAGVEFEDAKRLIENLQDALDAAEFRKKALEEIDMQHWAKAEVNLTTAHDLDPTDGVAEILMEHLRSLLKAQQLINNININSLYPVGRSAKLQQIRRIIDQTSHTTALSKLWQEVVSQLNDYNKFVIPQGISRVIFIMLVIASVTGGISGFYNWFAGIIISVVFFGVAVVLFILSFFSGDFWR